ncbi:MAG: dihydropteroate synthase [Firmicutes bacterium]|nr:dihydropteroate synthase [Bacillota bacterium]
MAFSIRLISANQPAEVWKEMNRIGVSPEGLELMIGKGEFLIVKVSNISAPAANILKQEMLAKGGEVALGKEMAYLRSEVGEAIIMGTRTQYRRLLDLLPRQPFGLAALAQDLNHLLNTLEEEPPPLTLKNQRFEWGKKTYIMGIINITPDSFSGDGLLARDRLLTKVLRQAEAFLEAGADVLDIGGQSTRPGYTQISVEEEKRRVLPVLETLAQKIPLPLSVDTYKPAVAEAALAAGADLINDIWGLQGDPTMVKVAAVAQAPVIVMHNKTTPDYTDLMGEVASFLQNSIDLAVAHGLPREKIIVDPGIGFGKTPEQNLIVLNRLDELKALGAPILLGTSRKSLIGHVLGLPVDQRLEGTAATVAVGITRGAHLIRVHDVEEMVRVARMTDAILHSGNSFR